VSTISVTVVTEALRDPDAFRANVDRVERERDRFADGLGGVGWTVWPSVTNFLLVGLGSRERAARVGEGLLRRGLVPRTFGAGHPLADHLRLTIRDRDDNERFVAAAADIEAEIAAGGSAR
jgi:histidinol-phosphate aminotransferase